MCNLRLEDQQHLVLANAEVGRARSSSKGKKARPRSIPSNVDPLAGKDAQLTVLLGYMHGVV